MQIKSFFTSLETEFYCNMPGGGGGSEVRMVDAEGGWDLNKSVATKQKKPIFVR